MDHHMTPWKYVSSKTWLLEKYFCKFHRKKLLLEKYKLLYMSSNFFNFLYMSSNFFYFIRHVIEDFYFIKYFIELKKSYNPWYCLTDRSLNPWSWKLSFRPLFYRWSFRPLVLFYRWSFKPLQIYSNISGKGTVGTFLIYFSDIW